MRAAYPRMVKHELDARVRYPLRIETPAGPARFRRSRWERMNEGRDGGVVRYRNLAGWLSDGAERAAFLEMDEFDPSPDTYWDELWCCADGLSAQAGDAVEAMREAFGGAFTSAADWGSIVLLTCGWVAPSHRTKLDQRAALDAVLPVLTPDYGLIVLLAHPLEFDEDDETGAPVELGNTEWRRRALMRHYERALGFRPFETKESRRDVMWRARPNVQQYVLARLSEKRQVD